MPDDLIKEARERFEAAEEADRDNANEALIDLKFRAGQQWEEADRLERDKFGRPCLTINRLPQFVSQVTGDIRLNPPSVKVRPAGDDATTEMAETFTGLIRNIEAQSDADAVYITAVENAATCGIGHFKIVTEYAEDDGWDQDIRLRRILSPFAVLYDPAATDAVRLDAEFCFEQQWLPKATFAEKYPKASDTGWDGNGNDWRGWARAKDIRVVQYWRKVAIRRRLLRLNDGATVDMTGRTDAEIAEVVQLGGGLSRERMVDGHKVEMRLMNGVEEIAERTEWAGKYLPYLPVIGHEVHIGEEVIRHGVVRFARVPQQIFNLHRSSLAEAVNSAPKAKWLVTAEMIAGYEAVWKQANTTNAPALPYKAGKNGEAPQRIAPDIPGQGLLQEIGLAAQDLEATTGIYRDQLGKESNAQSGKAILARQREGDVGTFIYADNLARAVAHAGRILVDLIPKIYDTAREVRILGEDGKEEFVPINQTVIDPMTGRQFTYNDITVGKYDVVASTGPNYATQREEAAESQMAFIAAVPQAGAVTADLIAKNMNWPGADDIAKRLRKMLPPGLAEPEEGDPPPPPPQPSAEVLLAQAEMAKAQASMAKVESDQKLRQAELILKAHELGLDEKRLGLDGMEAQAKARNAEANTQIKAVTAAAGIADRVATHAVDRQQNALNHMHQIADRRMRAGQQGARR